MFLYISSLHPGWEPSRKMKNKSLPYPDSWHQEKIQNVSETMVITLILLHLNESIFCIFPGLVVAGTGHWTWSADWLLSKWLSINQTNTRMLTNQGPHNTSSCLQHQHLKHSGLILRCDQSLLSAVGLFMATVWLVFTLIPTFPAKLRCSCLNKTTVSGTLGFQMSPHN